MAYLGNSDHFQRARVRQAFLNAAVEVEPRLLSRLAAALPSAGRRWWPRKKQVRSFPPLPPDQPILPAVQAWAQSFGLDGSSDMWVERAATVTLHYWYDNLARERIVVGPTSLHSPGFLLEPFRFAFEFKYPETPARETDIAMAGPTLMQGWWQPDRQKWEHFRRQAKEQLNQELSIALDKYRLETERGFWGADWRPLRKKRKQREHLHWTALFQVRKWSYTRIAREELGSDGGSDDSDRRKVEDAVGRTAKHLGLRLRRAQKGHPRKPK